MKLEIVFEDGRKESFDHVASFEACHVYEVAQTPTEGKRFEVNPLGMDRNSFENPREDHRQECTRQLIQEAFAKVDKHPEKYASPFYTMIPEKNWDDFKTVADHHVCAYDLGGEMADWVEQALEWAQRISNGESWEAICNNLDTAKWFRMIVWKNGDARLVGGSSSSDNDRPASAVGEYDYGGRNALATSVPLIVFKKK